MGVRCPYCKQPAILVTGKEIYPHRTDLVHLKFYSCVFCDAYVGCHRNGTGDKPLGTLANRRLRNERKLAHAEVDSHWKSGKLTRTEVYCRLSELMGLTKEETHIAMFTLKQCQRARNFAMTLVNWTPKALTTTKAVIKSSFQPQRSA